MVLLGRIELPTSPLPRVRSTTELQQRLQPAKSGAVSPSMRGRGALLSASGPIVKRRLRFPEHGCIAMAMNDDVRKPQASPAAAQTREERLAAKLRENLRRRKAQARALGTPGNAASDAQPD